MSRSMLCLLVVLPLAVIGAALPANATDWPTFHQNVQLTGVTPDKGPETNDLFWTPIQTTAPVLASPVIANGALFVGNTNGYFYSIDTQTGSANWVVKLGTIHGTAAVDNGVVYVLDEDAKLWGLDVTTGAPKQHWPKQLGDGQHDW
jgi:eukaryotic-like serine/threonine-protein kinase